MTWEKDDRGNVDALERWSVEVCNVQQVWSIYRIIFSSIDGGAIHDKAAPSEVEGALLVSG